MKPLPFKSEMPIESKIVTLLWLEDGALNWGNTLEAKRHALSKNGGPFFACWTGNWRSDVFEVPARELENAVNSE